MSLKSLMEEMRLYGADDFCRKAKKKGVTEVTISYHEESAQASGKIHYFTLSAEGLRDAVTDDFVPTRHSLPGIPMNPSVAALPDENTLEYTRITEKLSKIRKYLGSIPLVSDGTVPEKYLPWLNCC